MSEFKTQIQIHKSQEIYTVIEMVAVIENGRSDTSSNPEQGCMYFHIVLIAYESNNYPSRYGLIGQTRLFNLGMTTGLREGKL